MCSFVSLSIRILCMFRSVYCLIVLLCVLTVCKCIPYHCHRDIGALFDYPEDFPCFFLSCKANANVQLAKTGHGPHFPIFSSFYCYVCSVLCILCTVLFKCVLYCCHRDIGELFDYPNTFVLDISSPVRQMPGYTSQRRGTARASQFFLLLCMFHSVHCLCVNVYCTTVTVTSGNFSTTLTEVFPYFVLSCKANARVQLAKTGKCVLYCCHRVSTQCVLYCCHRVSTQLQLK
jgi:hypothetical protein